ncbi:MAG: FAA hydrolase family protein [Alphaproteobacteria bacterium]|nr:FAA hydrolase family protein [Alphaproteobacteria bacterium]
MKLISYRHKGKDGFGVAVGAGVVEVGQRLGGRHGDIRAVLAAGALGEVAKAIAGKTADIGLDQVEFRPVIGLADKIICVGLNYETHRVETGRDKSEKPVLFTRFNDSHVGHGQPMIKPKNSERYDYEGELAAIIGKPGRYIAEADALGHIAGYSCYNDGSVRDWQRHTHQFTPGKNFPRSGAFGPWMVTTDDIPDPSKLVLMTRLNGQEVQKAPTDHMIFNVPYLIHYISQFTALNPGDVIVTGTPGGVGDRRTPPLYMKPGDVCEIEIAGIGILRNPVASE